MSMKRLRQILGLECHGDQLLSGQVTAAMNAALITWTILFVIETLAWGAALSLAYNVLLAIMLAPLVPLLIVFFDITVYTVDLKRANLWLAIATRLVVIATFNLVTATPMVMSLFDTEIKGQLLADARATAVVLINEDYTRRIEAQDTLIAQGVESEEAIRTDAKKEMDELRKRAATFEEDARAEVQRESRPGFGSITDFFAGNRDALEKRRGELRTKLQSDLSLVKLDERRSGLIKLKNEQAETLARVPSMQMEELKEYGANASGVLARLSALHKLQDANTTVDNTSIVLHLGVLMFGLLAFSMKFLQHSATDRYYSLAAQARVGMDTEIAAWESAKCALVKAIRVWQIDLADRIAKEPHIEHSKLDAHMGGLWHKNVLPHLNTFEEAETLLRNAGVETPWEVNDINDPRTQKEPWRTSVDALKFQFLWKGPNTPF